MKWLNIVSIIFSLALTLPASAKTDKNKKEEVQAKIAEAKEKWSNKNSDETKEKIKKFLSNIHRNHHHKHDHKSNLKNLRRPASAKSLEQRTLLHFKKHHDHKSGESCHFKENFCQNISAHPHGEYHTFQARCKADLKKTGCSNVTGEAALKCLITAKESGTSLRPACSTHIYLLSQCNFGGPTDPPTDPQDPPTDPQDPPTDPQDPPTDPQDPPTDPLAEIKAACNQEIANYCVVDDSQVLSCLEEYYSYGLIEPPCSTALGY